MALLIADMVRDGYVDPVATITLEELAEHLLEPED
jgi:hypothetical protein